DRGGGHARVAAAAARRPEPVRTELALCVQTRRIAAPVGPEGRLMDLSKLRRMLGFVLLSLAAVPAFAELKIEISRGVERAVPIAAGPVGWQGQALGPPFDVAAPVSADLQRSGRFDPMDRADMLQRPTTGTEVNFGDWRIQRTDVLVIGRLVQQGPDQY